MAVIDFCNKTIKYYDSMGSTNNKCLQVDEILFFILSYIGIIMRMKFSYSPTATIIFIQTSVLLWWWWWWLQMCSLNIRMCAFLAVAEVTCLK